MTTPGQRFYTTSRLLQPYTRADVLALDQGRMPDEDAVDVGDRVRGPGRKAADHEAEVAGARVHAASLEARSGDEIDGSAVVLVA